MIRKQLTGDSGKAYLKVAGKLKLRAKQEISGEGNRKHVCTQPEDEKNSVLCGWKPMSERERFKMRLEKYSGPVTQEHIVMLRA